MYVLHCVPTSSEQTLSDTKALVTAVLCIHIYSYCPQQYMKRAQQWPRYAWYINSRSWK